MIIGLKITEEREEETEGFAVSVGCRSSFSRDYRAFSYRCSHPSRVNERAKKYKVKRFAQGHLRSLGVDPGVAGAVPSGQTHKHAAICFSSLYHALGRAGSHFSRPRAAFEGEALPALPSPS